MSLISVGIIPARIGSTRFPAKVIAPLCGKPLLQYIWESAKKSCLSRVVIATDSEDVRNVAEGFGAEVAMTASSLPSGTDRVAVVAAEIPADIVVNLQADEPLLPAGAIDDLLRVMEQNPGFEMATLAIPRNETAELQNPNVVKAVMNCSGKALYFSRQPLQMETGFLRHIGIYAFQRAALQKFCALSPSPLEKTERLEQLRALENGMHIQVVLTDQDTVAVDTPEDLLRVEHIFKTRPELYNGVQKENP